jgi:hypothetical protein
MTEPTLTDWHTLFTTVRERFPDAPGLPEGYFLVPHLKAFPEKGYSLYFGFSEDPPEWGHFVPYTVALCVMLDWAMRFGAWWTLSDPKCEINISPEDHVWSVDVYHRRNIEDRGRLMAGLLLSADFKSHHAAYFEAVQAVVNAT